VRNLFDRIDDTFSNKTSFLFADVPITDNHPKNVEKSSFHENKAEGSSMERTSVKRPATVFPQSWSAAKRPLSNDLQPTFKVGFSRNDIDTKSHDYPDLQTDTYQSAPVIVDLTDSDFVLTNLTDPNESGLRSSNQNNSTERKQNLVRRLKEAASRYFHFFAFLCSYLIVSLEYLKLSMCTVDVFNASLFRFQLQTENL
jgi:hypothetical protein